MTRAPLFLALLLCVPFLGQRPVRWFETCRMEVVIDHPGKCVQQQEEWLMPNAYEDCAFDAGPQRVCHVDPFCPGQDGGVDAVRVTLMLLLCGAAACAKPSKQNPEGSNPKGDEAQAGTDDPAGSAALGVARSSPVASAFVAADTWIDCGDAGCAFTYDAGRWSYLSDLPTAVFTMSHRAIATYNSEIAWTEDNWTTYTLSTDGCRAVDAGLWDCCGGVRLRDGGCPPLPSY